MATQNKLTKDTIFLAFEMYIESRQCQGIQYSMAEYEDRTTASQPLREEYHFRNKEQHIETDRNHIAPDLNVSWDSIAELGLLAKTSDGIPCGNVICKYKDNIVVMDFGSFRLQNEYIIPISRINGYDGKYVYLSVTDETNLEPYSY